MLGPPADAGPAEPSSSSGGSSGSGWARRWRPLLLASLGYLALSVLLWWNVWASHPTSVTTCGCGDPALFTSFIEWPAYAIRHGLNPFYSTAIHYPGGVNMLANTSVLAIGVTLAPITWLFGPVATLNVASTLAPVLSGLAMFVLLRRWVAWSPAAFIGGLLYGFSPFMVIALSWAHLMLALGAVPPLILICLDELLIRQRRRPVAMGVVLGLLVGLQFFIGSEILLIVALFGAVGLVLVVAYGGWHDPATLRHRATFALVGLGSGAVTAVVLLAYPVWFAVAGPGHFNGPVWPTSGGSNGVATSATLLQHYVLTAPPQVGSARLDHLTGGYQGPILDDQYFGIGLLMVLVVGVAVWRRDRRLWLFGAIGVISVVLSQGSGTSVWLPWRLVAGLPLFEDVYPYRLVFITYLAVAIMLGLIIDHTYQAVRQRTGQDQRDGGGTGSSRLLSGAPNWSAAAAGVIVAAVALVPTALYLAQTTPLTTRSVDVPTWFAAVGSRLPGHQVLLVFPARSGTATDNDSPMTWQAANGMRWALVGTGGPSGVPQRAGPERRGDVVIGGISAPLGAKDRLQPGDITAVRLALEQWGVTLVVIPDQDGLPAYDQISSVPLAAGMVTAATGIQPTYRAGAWVWTLTHQGLQTPAGDQRLAECVPDRGARSVAAVRAATECVAGGASA